VLVRAGHTEAACDLARMAGFGDAGVICEVLNEDGTMARRPDLEAFATKHGLKIGTIADLIEYRVVNESTVEEFASEPVRTEQGEFRLHAFRDRIAGNVHLALVRGQPEPEQVTLVRVQGALAVRDLLGVQAPGSSGWNARRCLERIATEGRGVLVLLGEPESPGDLLQSIEQALGRRPPSSVRPPLEQQALTIGVGSQILRSLGVRKLRLMGSAVKYSAISGFGLEIVEYLKP
jgi:3,4-dihydroxy 2-butanone 4-phosphate synthase / GTP cyclohydrolase II